MFGAVVDRMVFSFFSCTTGGTPRTGKKTKKKNNTITPRHKRNGLAHYASILGD